MSVHAVSESEFEAVKAAALSGRRKLLPLLLAWTSLVVSNPAQAGPNHLNDQAAPYLNRAVSQAVDWYPWGADAFKRAKELNRPILLDMGSRLVWRVRPHGSRELQPAGFGGLH